MSRIKVFSFGPETGSDAEVKEITKEKIVLPPAIPKAKNNIKYFGSKMNKIQKIIIILFVSFLILIITFPPCIIPNDKSRVCGYTKHKFISVPRLCESFSNKRTDEDFFVLYSTIDSGFLLAEIVVLTLIAVILFVFFKERNKFFSKYRKLFGIYSILFIISIILCLINGGDIIYTVFYFVLFSILFCFFILFIYILKVCFKKKIRKSRSL